MVCGANVSSGWPGSPVWRGCLAAGLLASALLGPARSEAEGVVLLTVTDASGARHAFDLTTLDAMPQISFTTTTLWTDGPITFSGPPLRAVLQEAGITSGPVELMALNDYAVTLVVEELGPQHPIIATRKDGATFGVRDNGPLWLVYPFDTNRAFQDETIFAASVWQLIAVAAIHP